MRRLPVSSPRQRGEELLRRAGGWGLLLADELDSSHGGTIALAVPEFEDPGVTAWAIRVTWPDVREQLVYDIAVRDDLQDLSPGRHVATLRERDEFFGMRPEGLCLACVVFTFSCSNSDAARPPSINF
jgi:hypothetical protein